MTNSVRHGKPQKRETKDRHRQMTAQNYFKLKLSMGSLRVEIRGNLAAEILANSKIGHSRLIFKAITQKYWISNKKQTAR